MLKDPQQIASTVRTLSSELETPISAKIRLGWDQQNRNYLQIAKILEDNGASLIAVHGRTKNQGYEQQADWDAIAEVKSHLTIPVVGNGDVETVSDIARMKEHTNCDGIMIGRAAMGNPWIFQRRDRMTISKSEWAQVVYGHLSYMRKFYGTQRGLILFRKHLTHYLAPFELPNTTRKALLTRRRLSQLLDLLEHVGFPSPRSTTHQDTFDPLPACEAVQVS
jgi:tRNA-dihydrouridine synthase